MTSLPFLTAVKTLTFYFSAEEKHGGQRAVSYRFRLFHGRRKRPVLPCRVLRQSCALLLFLLLGSLWSPASICRTD